MNHDWHAAHDIQLSTTDHPKRLTELFDKGAPKEMICAHCGERVRTNDPEWEMRKSAVCQGTTAGMGNSPNDQKLGYIVKHSEQVHIALRLKVLLAQTERPLRVKIGMDPTAPDLTLGHMVPLRLVRAFQDWGHKAVVIVGDTTACVGDPTGVNQTRPMLTREQVAQNVKTYLSQLAKVLKTGDNHFELRYNSEWLCRLNIYDIIELTSQHSVRQMLQRETFRERFESYGDIRMHEIMYPLLQGYDSFAVKADIEIGGTDQLFNMLIGREVQQRREMSPQIVISTPLLVGLDGIQKMSKSKGNCVSLNDSPEDMFGKIMSIKDTMMPDYFRLLTGIWDNALQRTAAESLIDRQPMMAKMRLARIITGCVHGEEAAGQAETDFNSRIREGNTPVEMPELILAAGTYAVSELLVKANMVPSKTVAAQKIREGAVKIDGSRISQKETAVTLSETGKVIQIGKRRFVRVKIAKDDLPVTGDPTAA